MVKQSIDATHEGDLLAAAGINYHVGRESKEACGEQWNGVQTGVLQHGHHFGAVKTNIRPTRIEPQTFLSLSFIPTAKPPSS
jgi:hypothetical protein